MSVKPLRARQAEASRSLLIEVARKNFTEHGYAATSIDDIIQQAGVARGALYHHFSGKERCCSAIYERVEGEVVARVMEAAASQTSPWDAVRAGFSMFLDACLEPAFRRIVVLDSVSVLQSKVLEIGIDPVAAHAPDRPHPAARHYHLRRDGHRRGSLRRPRRPLRRLALYRPRFGPACRPS